MKKIFTTVLIGLIAAIVMACGSETSTEVVPTPTETISALETQVVETEGVSEKFNTRLNQWTVMSEKYENASFEDQCEMLPELEAEIISFQGFAIDFREEHSEYASPEEFTDLFSAITVALYATEAQASICEALTD